MLTGRADGSVGEANPHLRSVRRDRKAVGDVSGVGRRRVDLPGARGLGDVTKSLFDLATVGGGEVYDDCGVAIGEVGVSKLDAGQPRGGGR